MLKNYWNTGFLEENWVIITQGIYWRLLTFCWDRAFVQISLYHLLSYHIYGQDF